VKKKKKTKSRKKNRKKKKTKRRKKNRKKKKRKMMMMMMMMMMMRRRCDPSFMQHSNMNVQVVHLHITAKHNRFVNSNLQATCFGTPRLPSGINAHNLKHKWTCVRSILQFVRSHGC